MLLSNHYGDSLFWCHAGSAHEGLLQQCHIAIQ
jgi:hypothetical protein